MDHYIDPHYSIQKALDIYSGVFHSYGDVDNWPHVSGPKIVLDKNLVNRGRRKKVRATMVMDEMEGTSRGTSRQRWRNCQRTTQESKPSQPSQPIPMEAILSGHRGTVTPPRRSQRRNERVQAGKHSVSIDRRNPTPTVTEPRRNSISVDPRSIASRSRRGAQSARFPTTTTTQENVREGGMAGNTSASGSGSTSRSDNSRFAERLRCMLTRGGRR